MNWIVLFMSIAVFHLSRSAPTTPSTETAEPDYLRDIFSAIPKDLIKNITNEHLKTDEGFKAAVKYMQSDEWTNRVEIIRAKSEWMALKKYMKNVGINMDMFIKCAEGFLKNVTVTLDPEKPAPRKSVGAFLLDLEKNLPTMKILTAIHEKMIRNAKLQNLFDKIATTDTRKMIDNVLLLPEVKCMLKDLADMDMNFMGVLSFMYTFLGWGELKLD